MFKSIFSDNFLFIFRASNYQLVDKIIKTEMLFKLSNLNPNLALTLGYLNPALNNSAQVVELLLLDPNTLHDTMFSF